MQKLYLVEWLKTLLNEEEQKKVNVKNVLTLFLIKLIT